MAVDFHLDALQRHIRDDIAREGLPVDRELSERLFRQSAPALVSMLLDRCGVTVGQSTVRASVSWNNWKDHRGRKLPGSAAGGISGQDLDGMNVGGAKKTADERDADAATARWLASNGHSLDD